MMSVKGIGTGRIIYKDVQLSQNIDTYRTHNMGSHFINQSFAHVTGKTFA